MSVANPSTAATRKQRTLLAWIGPIHATPPSPLPNVTQFQDSDDFLLAPNAFDFDFFVVQLAQRGVRGIDLIRLIRRRSAAGILALSHEAHDEFVGALDSGADMVIARDAPAEHLLAAIAAVQRRVRQGLASTQEVWKLQEDRAVLLAPDGTQIDLSASDLAIMQCFAAAAGGQVSREVLLEQLWGSNAASMDNALHATLYRLRKRIEQAGQALVPVHAVAKVGYEFRAPLVRG